jgi:hypothetical protein
MPKKTPTLIIERVVEGLRLLEGLNKNNCFQSIVPAYIEGQSPKLLQVIPGGFTNDAAPDGGQDGGGCNYKRMQISIVYWHVLNIDRPGRSDQVLVKEADGMLEFIEQIHDHLRWTFLGGLLYAPLRYEGETPTSWFDIDKGVTERTINFSAPFAEKWPPQPSLNLPAWRNK